MHELEKCSSFSIPFCPFKCAVFRSHDLSVCSSVTKGNLLHSMIRQWDKVTVAPVPSRGMVMSCIEISLGSFD